MRTRRELPGVEYAVQVWNRTRRNWDTEDITYSLVDALTSQQTIAAAGVVKRVRLVKRHVVTERTPWQEVQ